MPAQSTERRPGLETTYKAREVEGLLDLYFYRRLGFWLARVFARLKLPPAGVSLLGAVIGVIAGHLYFYRNLAINTAGMALHDTWQRRSFAVPRAAVPSAVADG